MQVAPTAAPASAAKMDYGSYGHVAPAASPSSAAAAAAAAAAVTAAAAQIPPSQLPNAHGLAAAAAQQHAASPVQQGRRLSTSARLGTPTGVYLRNRQIVPHKQL